MFKLNNICTNHNVTRDTNARNAGHITCKNATIVHYGFDFTIANMMKCMLSLIYIPALKEYSFLLLTYGHRASAGLMMLVVIIKYIPAVSEVETVGFILICKIHGLN